MSVEHIDITLPQRLRDAVSRYDRCLYPVELEAADAIIRLVLLLKNAVYQADGWHDECRSGPIEDDELMDEAREIISQFP